MVEKFYIGVFEMGCFLDEFVGNYFDYLVMVVDWLVIFEVDFVSYVVLD